MSTPVTDEWVIDAINAVEEKCERLFERMDRRIRELENDVRDLERRRTP